MDDFKEKKNKGFQTLHNFSFAQCPMTKYSKAKIQFVHSWHSFETATIRVTVKSSSFLLRFLSANGKISSCEKTIFMKKVRKDPPSSDITNLKYHGHTTKTLF